MVAVMIRQPSSRAAAKRGVLLLVVLSMLTLFLMLGSTYLVVAIRARKVARAFSHRGNAAAMAGPNASRLVDNAFLAVARGTLDSTVPHLGEGDDLLGDKYGSDSLTGSIQSVSAFQGSDAFIELTESSLDPQATLPKLPGRVLTFTLPGLTGSVRIISAGAAPGANKIVVAAGMTPAGRAISVGSVAAALDRAAANSKHFVINGREFDDSGTNEPYDGFDAENPLLARILPDLTGNPPDITRATLSGTTSLNVDNDGDGKPDSQFLPLGLPGFTVANGTRIEPRAAILVLDLDGRINLNVHDALGGIDTLASSGTASLYPNHLSVSGTTLAYDDASGTPKMYLRSLPLGIGGSPAGAAIRKGFSFQRQAPTDVGSSVRDGARAAGGVAATSLPDDFRTSRPSPQVGDVEGRYGKSTWNRNDLQVDLLPRPGEVGFNDPITSWRDRWSVAVVDGPNPNNKLAANYFSAPGRYGSPPDIKGRMRIWVDPVTGQPVFFKPYWDEYGRSPPNRTLTDNELVDDPYELNLTRTGPQIATLSNLATGGMKVDNPFSASDLESLLRFYDADTLCLSRRLPALLSEVTADARLRVTTESWDTTAVVGSAWRDAIESNFSAVLRSGTAANAFFARETIGGNKLDVSRPLHSTDYSEPNDAIGTARRQQFARHIYSLLIGIADANAATLDSNVKDSLAQYAVNIVDFRDADSIMTRFEYDPNFGPGSTTWSPSKTVWGCERPELVITETLAWHDRRTDDLAVGGKMRSTAPAPPIAAEVADDDFDQQHRPRGAFFVELTIPPASAAMRFDAAAGDVGDVLDPVSNTDPVRAQPLPKELVANEDANNNGAIDGGEDANANGVIDDSPSRMLRSTTIQLDKVVANASADSRSPVWRLVSVSGTAAFGNDPMSGVTANTSKCILDPGRDGGPTVERAFYFAEPPPKLKASPAGDPSATNTAPSNGVFWLSSGTSPLRPQTVVGTNLPYAAGGVGTAAANVLTFSDGQGRPGTLSEPLTKHSSKDPYQVLSEQAFINNSFTGGQWGSPLERPIDAAPQADFDSAPDITSKPFVDATGAPLLMQNGTHENFAVVHLQRLANPTVPWDPVANPYLTVDSMPIDLTVVNYEAGGSGLCFDEPGISGPSPLVYLQQQKNFGRAQSTRPESVERGGKRSTGPNDELNLWNSRVDSTQTNLRDGLAMHSASIASRASNGGYTPPDPASDPVVLTAVVPLAPDHTLGNPPSRGPARAAFSWFFFPNRPYESGVEVSLAPISSPFQLLKQYSLDTGLAPLFAHLPGFWEDSLPPDPWPAVTGRSAGHDFGLLDFLHVPSRFGGLAATVPLPPDSSTGAALLSLGLDQLPYGHIPHWREPGRINLNTVTSGTTTSGTAMGAWRAIFGPVDFSGDSDVGTSANLDSAPPWNAEMFASPQANFVKMVDSPSIPIARNDWTGPSNAHRDTNRNVAFRYSSIMQVADRITTRSNVFAVWVTVGFFEVDTSGAVIAEVTPKTRLRGFYLFDRSIPVAYERGRDHNVTDAVLLRRIIQ
jgi:hypothetical protein